MRLGYHGGHCCAMKTIYNFPLLPSEILEPLKVVPRSRRRRPDLCGDSFRTNKRFFWPSAPEEAAKARFKRYVDYVDEYQPGCIIEVTLANYQNSGWLGVLLDQGFTAVSSVKNSNSGNTVTVYHRVHNKG